MLKNFIKKFQSGYTALFTGLVLITLLFVSYNYFSDRQPEKGSILEKMQQIFNKTEEPAGQIDELAAQDSRVQEIAGAATEAPRLAAWSATDYKQGEITSGSYEVKRGDTLWEIAEAVYGDGTQWHKILEANKDDVGFLPNSSQALIIVGQVLVIP